MPPKKSKDREFLDSFRPVYATSMPGGGSVASAAGRPLTPPEVRAQEAPPRVMSMGSPYKLQARMPRYEGLPPGTRVQRLPSSRQDVPDRPEPQFSIEFGEGTSRPLTRHERMEQVRNTGLTEEEADQLEYLLAKSGIQD